MHGKALLLLLAVLTTVCHAGSVDESPGVLPSMRRHPRSSESTPTGSRPQSPAGLASSAGSVIDQIRDSGSPIRKAIEDAISQYKGSETSKSLEKADLASYAAIILTAYYTYGLPGLAASVYASLAILDPAKLYITPAVLAAFAIRMFKRNSRFAIFAAAAAVAMYASR
nr:hypothetical protein [Amarillovirales sp.]